MANKRKRNKRSKTSLSDNIIETTPELTTPASSDFSSRKSSNKKIRNTEDSAEKLTSVIKLLNSSNNSIDNLSYIIELLTNVRDSLSKTSSSSKSLSHSNIERLESKIDEQASSLFALEHKITSIDSILKKNYLFMIKIRSQSKIESRFSE